jgi:uncharacterized membrane protein YqhA
MFGLLGDVNPVSAPTAPGLDRDARKPSTHGHRLLVRAGSLFGRMANWFERGLWWTRLIVLVAVLAIILMALSAFVLASVDSARVIGYAAAYATASPVAGQGDPRVAIITGIVKSVDAFLIGVILLLIAFGLYELFVGRLEVSGEVENHYKTLRLKSVDDLKTRIVKLIVLILIIEFFQEALRLPYQTPLDLLYVAVAITLISVAGYISALGTK